MADWQVGDLAACVDTTPCQKYGECLLSKGQTYRVIGTHRGTCFTGPALGLILAGVTCKAPGGYNADRFRKIRPDELTKCEPEFVTLLKRQKADA